MVWSVCVLCLCNFLIFNYWYLVPCGTEIQGPNKERNISLCSLVFSTTVIKLRSLLKYILKMTWLVVQFDAEDTVEAVPNTWYVKEKLKCYWPTQDTAKHIIIEFIKKKQLPQTNWLLYGANILGSYDDYKVAQKKANKAKNTNNLSSNNEALKQKRIKKKSRRHKKSENEHESTETEISSVDDTIYPDLETPLRNESGLDKDIEIASTSRATSTSTINATLHHKSKIYEHSIKFEQQVLKELNVLNLKLDGISECVNVLINNTANKTQTSTSISYEIPEEILESLPVNDQSLVQLENWLSCEKNKTILSQNLSRIGGFNVKEIVRRIMYRAFTNEVDMCYSWEGAKKKKIFLNLAIATTILSAVRLNKNAQNCTDIEIINFIKAWLVRSKDRFNNNKNKEIINEEIEAVDENLDVQATQPNE